MSEKNTESDNDFDADGLVEIDEHEYEISTNSNRPIHWRRIELLREQMELKKQIDDYDDLMN
jgi:hypothetical protein